MCRQNNDLKPHAIFDQISPQYLKQFDFSIWAQMPEPTIIIIFVWRNNPDTKIRGANMGPTWVLSAPEGPHVGPMNLAIREDITESNAPYITRFHDFRKHRGAVKIDTETLFYLRQEICFSDILIYGTPNILSVYLYVCHDDQC